MLTANIKPNNVYGFVTNKRFCEISGLDTLRASELLKKWTKQKLLEKEGTSKRNMAYRKPTTKRYGRGSLLEGIF